MMMSLDFVGRRYGVLPSTLLATGSSLDMVIADAAQGYETYIRERSQGKGVDHTNHGLTEEQMLAMVAQAKQGA